MQNRTVTLTAQIERKGSEIVETKDFTLSSLVTPLFNADGSRDDIAMSARSAAVAKTIFGIVELDNAIKQLHPPLCSDCVVSFDALC